MSQDFDGATYDKARDGGRLQRQLATIKGIMFDHKPHTLTELAGCAGCLTTSASARVRDLRKKKHGGHTVTRKNIGGGVWEYTLQP
jgi:hypothetical protein